MNKSPRKYRPICRLFGGAAAVSLLALAGPGAHAQAAIDAGDWGSVTAPVYGTTEAGVYAGADLFAGPNKFGSYYHGVLPNGKIVRPAGISAQIGMNPLGAAVTPDGKYLITSNDDERDGGYISLQSAVNLGGYSLSVVRASDLKVVSQINTSGTFYIGLQVKGSGPYTVYASGGADQTVKLFTVSASGTIAKGTPASITIAPLLSGSQGYVSNYTPAKPISTPKGTPTGYSASGAKITFPAGSALSPNGRFLYVACNGDNSLAVIDTTTNSVVKQVPVGYFPYAVSVSSDGSKVMVSNWGVTEYKFSNPTYDAGGKLAALDIANPGTPNQPDGFYVPATSVDGNSPKTSSVSIVTVPGGDPTQATLLGSIYQGRPLDDKFQVGDTHPSATALVRRAGVEVLFVAKANDDSLGMILVNNNRKLADFDLSPVKVKAADDHKIVGAYPNALVASPDGSRLYVAEGGLNSVAVLDTTNPVKPKLLGRIPTGWYPTALAYGANNTLFIVNAKGIGEDINPRTAPANGEFPTGIESYTDGNFMFGSVQKVNLATLALDNTTALSYNFAFNPPADTSVVPAGGGASSKIKHVIFILHENKTFDSMLGNQRAHFGPYASTTFYNTNFGSPATAPNGNPFANQQYTGVSLNMQLLATNFATAVNYYSDSEESDAGHQYSASGTASDYTEKTLLVKSGRGILVNKNFEPEDYPASGYIFNNAARNGVSFKDYGALIRIDGTDTGTSTPTTLNDPTSGNAGVPSVDVNNNLVQPLTNLGDTETAVQGLGQSYFLRLPILSILGTSNPSGEPRLDRNYPGYNFNISDQRRAKEFIVDFDRMVRSGTLPQFLYIYQPNDHTGGAQTKNLSPTGIQLIADGDIGLGMVVNHIMNSPAYYDTATGEGSAIFITFDDAQSSLDHIHQHRTPLIVVSPYAKPAYLGKRHYNTASVVKTEELLMGLPPNNLGDLFATDLRDLFQPTYNGITTNGLNFTRTARYTPTPEGRKIWALVKSLDTSAPDRDSYRLGYLNRLTLAADDLHKAAVKKNRLHAASYAKAQKHLYQLALNMVKSGAPRDADD